MDFAGFLTFITDMFIKPITVLILSLAVVYFLWNIAEGIRKGDNPDELAAIKTKAFWGVVAIAVMVSLWGLVDILVNTFTPGAGLPLIRTDGRGGAPTTRPTSPPPSFPGGTGGGFTPPGDRGCYAYAEDGSCL